MESNVLCRPKGDKPEWQLVYEELLAAADFNDVITYERLDDALGRRFRSNRSPIYAARRHLGEMRQRWLEVVPGKGYRIIESREHMGVAQKHKRKARRQLGMMVKVGEVTDLSKLTSTELTAFDQQQRINVALYQITQHHEQRIRRIEAALRMKGIQ